MTEVDKYREVNNAESFEELAQAIERIGEWSDGVIRGRMKTFKTSALAYKARMGHNLPHPSHLTRSYGIRQQYLYIKWYEDNLQTD